MDERAFDKLLRDALAQANLEDQAEALDQTGEPDFSPAYLQDRMRLLADPKKWYRRRKSRAGWRRPLRSAACAALVCVLGFSCLVAASPNVRADILNWVMRRYDDHTEFRFPGDGETPDKVADYAVTALPAGFREKERYNDVFGSSVTYEDDGEAYIMLQCMSMQATTTMALDSEGAEIREITVNGCSGELYIHQPPKTNMMIWMDEEAQVSFFLMAPTDADAILEMAESVEALE